MDRKNKQKFERHIDIELRHLKRDIDLIYLPFIRDIQRIKEDFKFKLDIKPRSDYFRKYLTMLERLGVFHDYQ